MLLWYSHAMAFYSWSDSRRNLEDKYLRTRHAASIWSTELCIGFYEDHPSHTNMCTKSNWSHFLPSSITVFSWKPIALCSLFWHTKKTQRTSLFLIAAPTVIATKQNNWKLLGHMKYWRISLLADVLCTSKLICFLMIDMYYWQQKTAVGCQLELEISWKLW